MWAGFGRASGVPERFPPEREPGAFEV